MRYSTSGLRNRWMEACHRHGEPKAARVASVGVCYRGIATHLREMSGEKRRELLRDFFEDFPNGERLAEVAEQLTAIDFSAPAQLTRLVRPVNAHLAMLDLEEAVVEEVGWGSHPALDSRWADALRDFRMTTPPLPGPLARVLKELVDATLMAAPRTEVGRTAVSVPRDMILRMVWDLTDDVDTAWDHLGRVALLGWIPVGLGVEGTFLVARLPEMEPRQFDG